LPNGSTQAFASASGYAYDDDRVAEAIAREQLKRVLADWSLTSPGLYLYFSNRHHPQPALRAFIDCLLDRDKVASERRNRKVGAWDARRR
jgi:DNA-binding transcriptional LysR family regulator